MKRTHSLIALGAGLLLAVSGAAALVNGRTAEAASTAPRFVRPAFGVTDDSVRIDLTRFSALAEERKLAALARNPAACRAALSAAGVSFVTMAPAREGACGYAEAIQIDQSLAKWDANPGAPSVLPVTCGLAAKLHVWERHVVAPAAEKYLGSPVVEVKLMGSYQCRSVAGMNRLSEHAFAKAVDVAGFVLADGREISVLKDYRSPGGKGDFLREIRQRACDLFDVTLGPDYNADHANHFHLDVGGERACR